MFGPLSTCLCNVDSNGSKEPLPVHLTTIGCREFHCEMLLETTQRVRQDIQMAWDMRHAWENLKTSHGSAGVMDNPFADAASAARLSVA